MNTKRVLALLLSVVLAALLCTPVGAVTKQGLAIPVVYLTGQGVPLLDADGKQIYPLDAPDGYVEEAVKKCLPLFMEAYLTDDWTDYMAALQEALDPVFAPLRLSSDGEVVNGSVVIGAKGQYSQSDKISHGVYKPRDYTFDYDWRRDPVAVAEELNRYINVVKKATGSDRVHLIGRCEGACMVLAYLQAYGRADVQSLLLYCQAFSGVDAINALFTGTVQLDAASAERYADENLVLEDALLNELLLSTVSLAKETYGLQLAAGTVNLIYDRLCASIMPQLLTETFATMPGIWSMVSADRYREAREFIFAGREAEYAGLLEKLDRYQDTVRVPAEDILSALALEGLPIAVVAKYGKQNIPLSEADAELADGFSRLSSMSLGATTAPVGETLSNHYLEFIDSHRLSSYISADSQVDASTCLFRDTTWIIKGLSHRDFPACVDSLLKAWCSSDGQLTIDTDDRFPQFIHYDEETDSIGPLTKENAGVEEKDGFFGTLLRFFRSILAWFQSLFAKDE